MAAPLLLKYCRLLKPIFTVQFRCLHPQRSLFTIYDSSYNFTVKLPSVGSWQRREFSDHQSDGSGSSSDDEHSDGPVNLSARPKKRSEERRNFNKQNKPPHKEELTFVEKVAQAAEAVGQLSSEPEKITGDLLSRLRGHTHAENVTKESSGESGSTQSFRLGELLSSMKMEDVAPPAAVGSQRRVQTSEDDQFVVESKGGIITKSRLDIFDPSIMDVPHKPSLTPLFDKVLEEERQMFANFPPNNAFEEMIKWTREGKMWHFPIDNEQGLDEEGQVPFTDHVFLDHLLEGFPKKGPIRHFMELVIVALSKSPYLSVQEKHDQVAWFREYFKDKLHLVEIVDSPEKLVGQSE